MKRQEILANCIEDIRSGKSTIEECVSRYPEMGEELRSLLEITSVLKADDVTPSPEFVKRARRQLFTEMQSTQAKAPHNPVKWYTLAPIKWIAGVLIGLLVLGGASGGTVYASQDSLPGDALYPVKTSAENIQMVVTWGVEAKANLNLKLAQRRIDEATQQLQQNREVNGQALNTVEQRFNEALKVLTNSNDTAANDAVLSRFSVATLNQQIELEQALANAPESSKPVLEHAIDVTRRGNLISNVAYANHDFLADQPSVSDEGLDGGQFKVEGVLLSIHSNTWNVGGVMLENVRLPKNTIPAIGIHVKIEGLVKGNQVFVSRLELEENNQQPTKVEGKYGGTNENGTVDIGGIPVEITGNTSAQLEPGENVQLQGGHAEGKLDVTHEDNNQNKNHETTKLNGVLTAVSGNTITVTSLGSQILVNISEAQIENDNHHVLSLTELDQLVGENIKIDGLYKQDGSLFAHKVRVEVEEQTHDQEYNNQQDKNNQKNRD
jgi:hypothetical protein